MGAEIFYTRVKGNSAGEAFKQEREHACYENGHGGYTGTIAEKGDYTMSNKPKDYDADEWVDMVEKFDADLDECENYKALQKDYEVYCDKWGDALCVPTEDGFIFCGCASS